jgi:hypothetical protein
MKPYFGGVNTMDFDRSFPWFNYAQNWLDQSWLSTTSTSYNPNFLHSCSFTWYISQNRWQMLYISNLSKWKSHPTSVWRRQLPKFLARSHLRGLTSLPVHNRQITEGFEFPNDSLKSNQWTLASSVSVMSIKPWLVAMCLRIHVWSFRISMPWTFSACLCLCNCHRLGNHTSLWEQWYVIDTMLLPAKALNLCGVAPERQSTNWR